MCDCKDIDGSKLIVSGHTNGAAQRRWPKITNKTMYLPPNDFDLFTWHNV